MRSTRHNDRPAVRVVCLALLGLAGGAAAADSDSPIRFTEVRRHEIRRTVRLPGSVESRTSSLVASEVAGSVVAVEVRAGDRVRAGAPLVRLRPRYLKLRLEQAQGLLQEARSRLDLAQSKLERARELHRDQVVSQQDLDNALSEYAAWQGRESASRAEIAQLEFSLDRMVIRAPFDGVVVRKRTDLGEWVDVGGEVMEMVALGELEVRVEVPERYFSELRTGVEADVVFESVADLRLAGRVSAIIPRADIQARTFPIKVDLPAPTDRIGVGMLASVELPVGQGRSSLIVPKDAILRESAGEQVFRIDSTGRVETLAVETGQGFGSWIVVEGQLSVGDRVVTRGNERLRPGQQVQGSVLEYPLP